MPKRTRQSHGGPCRCHGYHTVRANCCPQEIAKITKSLGSAGENCGKLKPVAPRLMSRPTIQLSSLSGAIPALLLSGKRVQPRNTYSPPSARCGACGTRAPLTRRGSKNGPFGVAIASASPGQLGRHLQTVKPETRELSASQTVFDISEVPQRARGAGACRRLAAVMAELRWTAVRLRGLTRGGYREQVRGYCRRDAWQEHH
jgi:hypothetical protein